MKQYWRQVLVVAMLVMTVAVVRADSTVAILDSGGQNVGSTSVNEMGYNACGQAGHGFTRWTTPNQIPAPAGGYTYWKCSDNYALQR